MSSVLNVKALVGAFNQEKALVGVIVQPVVEPMDQFAALPSLLRPHQLQLLCAGVRPRLQLPAGHVPGAAPGAERHRPGGGVPLPGQPRVSPQHGV